MWGWEQGAALALSWWWWWLKDQLPYQEAWGLGGLWKLYVCCMLRAKAFRWVLSDSLLPLLAYVLVVPMLHRNPKCTTMHSLIVYTLTHVAARHALLLNMDHVSSTSCECKLGSQRVLAVCGPPLAGSPGNAL